MTDDRMFPGVGVANIPTLLMVLLQMTRTGV